MAKYLNHPKAAKQKKARGCGWFIFGMILYAVIFLTAAWFGLKEFWAYMEAYENSRPKNTVNAYMEQLTLDHICDLSQDVIDQIDHNLQSEEECRTYIKEQLGEVKHAKKTSECTETRQVYVLRSGTTVVGQFAIEVDSTDKYGFTTWKLAEESFDVSYMIGETVTATAPSDFIVSVNGHQLGSEYITVDKIIYEEIEEYYEDYELPYRVTYVAGPFLGEMEISIADTEGNPVVLDENTDLTAFFHNCSEEEQKKLDDFTSEFVKRYVAFTGSNKNTRYATFNSLMEYVVAGSDFAERLSDAIDGLQFGQSKGDKIVSLVAHHQVRLGEGIYLCDITYEIDTTGRDGVVRTTTNAKLIIVDTASGMKLQSISFY